MIEDIVRIGRDTCGLGWFNKSAKGSEGKTKDMSGLRESIKQWGSMKPVEVRDNSRLEKVESTQEALSLAVSLLYVIAGVLLFSVFSK